MSKKNLYVRIIGGALLLHQGFKLARMVLADRPEKMMLFLIIAAIFLILGAIFLFIGCKKMIKHEYIDEIEEEELIEEQSEEQE